MKRKANDVLDESLALIEEGKATIGECLARHPEYAADLRPLLEVAVEIHRLPRPTSSPAAFAAGKRRMLKALAEKKRRQPGWFSRWTERFVALVGARGPLSARGHSFAFQVALAAAATLVLLIVGGLFIHSWLGTTVTQAATLESASGVVEVLPAGSETWLPASAVERLEAGDRIRTGPLSAATLVFFNGSRTDLEAETEVTLAQMSSLRDGSGEVIVLHQWQGRSHNRVQPLPDPASRFEIETPTAVAAVRGTEFAVAVEADGTTQVVVREGLVEVTAQGTTVQVQPGQVTSVQPDMPPAPVVPASTPLPPMTLQPTPAQEPTEVPWPTATLRPTETPEPTKMVRPTRMPGAPVLPTPTETPVSPTPTPTPVPPSSVKTPVPSPSPTPTSTPTPSVMPTPPEPPAPPEPPKPPEPPHPPEPSEPSGLLQPPAPTESPAPTEPGD